MTSVPGSVLHSLRSVARAALLLLPLVSIGPLAGCESLWGAFVSPNEGNCLITPGLCTTGTVCSERTKRCEAPGDVSDGGTAIDGGPGGIGDLGPGVFPAPLPSCQRGGFCLHTPLTTGTLRGVVAFTTTSVWAAGGDVILQWDGSRWTRHNEAGGYVDLVDLVGQRSTGEVFALSRTGALYHEAGKGVRRLADSLPDPGKTVERLYALDASNVWAVGPGGAIWYWDGSRWTAEASSIQRNLHGVFGLSADAVWAVGDSGTVLRRTSTGGWSSLPGLVTGAALNGVWAAAPSSVFVVGDGGVIAVHSGTSWSFDASGTTTNLTAVTGSDPNAVFAVSQTGAVLTRIASGTWGPTPVTSRALYGISSLGSDLFAVGSQGLRAARLANIWSLSEGDALPRPAAIAPLADNSGKLLAVGVQQATMRNLADFNPATGVWSGGTATGATVLRGLSIRSADAFAVGDSGACARLSGTTWGACATAAGLQNLYSVWMDPAQMNNGWLVGQGGVVERWNGTSWTAIGSSTTADLHGVRGDATGDAWAVGQGGVILRCSGSSCTPETNPAGTATLRAVWVNPQGESFAVGDGGTVLRRGLMPPWVKLASPTTAALYAIWGTSTMVSTIYAVGARGTVLRSTDGLTWTALSSDTTADLTGVGGTDASNTWAVGPDAGWLRYVP
ncbi:MAG: hypothetical protein U1A78_03330 [Polyangia bacterium]